jgi:transposase
VLGASNYTYACATATQTAADWVNSIIDALEFIGGVTRESRARDSRVNQQDRIM